MNALINPRYRLGARRLERLLQLVTIVTAVLAGLLVDLASGVIAHATALAAAGVSAWIITDSLGWIRLPRWAVAILTLAAIVPIWNQFLGQDTFSQLSRISWLLTFWLSVIFFQEKNPRVFGSLIVLSLLLVVIAAILNSSLLFALLLLFYHFLGILSLVLLYAYSGHAALYEAFARQHRQLHHQMQSAQQRLLDGSPIAYQEPESLPDRHHVWPRGLLWHVLGLSLSTAVFAVGFFYLVPRVGTADWRAARDPKRALIGLTTEVTYEETSRIYESNQLAFRVAASDARTGKPYPFFEQVYFHAQTLTFYTTDTSGRALWRSFGRSLGRPLWPMPHDMPGERIRLDFLREPSDDGSLLYVAAPFAGVDTASSLRFDRFTSRIFRHEFGEHPSRRPLRYTLYSNAFRDRIQLPLTPVVYYDVRHQKIIYELPPNEKMALLEIDRARFPRLIAITHEILRSASETDTRLYHARLLQSYFHDTNRFTYTLDFREVARRRIPGLDPLEDFVANHRTGHCEYFAGALTLMLRAAGIPARLVIGYVGGEYNPLGNYYQVYERNAHAWVEAYLEPHEVPEGLLAQAIPPGGAAWYRLDPTPPDVLASQEAGLQFGVIDKVLDYAQLLWNTYVVELDNRPSAEQDAVGSQRRFPFAQHLLERLRFLRDLPREFWEDWRQSGWWNWRGGIVAAVAAMLVYLTWQMVVAAPRWLYGWLEAYRRRRYRHTQLAFYRRLERLLQRYGYQRQPEETQREFASRVAGDLPPEPVHEVCRQALAELVEVFYRVRFGRTRLDSGVLHQTDRLLQTVNRHLLQCRHLGIGPNGNGRVNKRAKRAATPALPEADSNYGSHRV